MPIDDERQTITIEELAYSGMLQTEAITRLLVKKGIITEEELLEEVKVLDAEQYKNANGVGMG